MTATLTGDVLEDQQARPRAPTDFPSAPSYNKQAFITGQKTGTEILPTE